jgi:gamma-glutamylcyclotransferase
MHYFAYGSNMSLARLRARVPSARRIGTYRLQAHGLRFHKVGRDGSGKCDAFHTRQPDHSVIGALFDIDPIEKAQLDLVEGVGSGYVEKQVYLAGDIGAEIGAFTYVATHIDSSLKPYTWYKHHVLTGARESMLPEEYIRAIDQIVSVPDRDRDREAAEYAIHASG